MEIITSTTRSGNRVESVIFNGIVYSRYPDRATKSYFKVSASNLRGTHTVELHRAVWESIYGEIPPKYHIHHKDSNILNNDISNLECLSPAEHYRVHREDRGVWAERDNKTFTLTCMQCGVEYISFFSTRGKNNFCSQKCSNLFNRQEKKYQEQRVCVICGKTFSTRKYTTQTTCSHPCGAVLANKQHEYTRPCVQCGKDCISFMPANGRNTFCSPDCAYKFSVQTKRYHILRECEVCKKEFSSPEKEQRTCSKTCGGIMRRKNKENLQV